MPEKDMVSEVEEVEVEPAEAETFEDEVEEIGSIAADEQPAADTAEQEPETEESQSPQRLLPLPTRWRSSKRSCAARSVTGMWCTPTRGTRIR